jgi:hypothetical protein
VVSAVDCIVVVVVWERLFAGGDLTVTVCRLEDGEDEEIA